MTGAFYDDPRYHFGDTSRHYDEVPSVTNLIWGFEVAWDGDMDYRENVANRAIACYWHRGRDTLVNYDGNGLTRYPPGRLVITLTNDDGKYDPNNTSSPLYPNVVPGKFCRLRVRTDASTIKDRFTGYVVNIRCYQNEKRERFVDIEASDGWGWLENRTALSPTDTDVAPDAAINIILDQIDWSSHWGSSLEAGPDTMAYWWCDGIDARQAIHLIAETQANAVYIRGDGKLYHRQRNTSPLEVFNIDQSQVLADINLNNPWETRWNYVRVVTISPLIVPFLDYGDGTVWSMGSNALIGKEDLVIQAGESITIEAPYEESSDNRPFIAMIPVLGSTGLRIQFGFFTFGDPSGVDISAFIDIVSFLDGGAAVRFTLENIYFYTARGTIVTIIGQVMRNNGETSFVSDRSGSDQRKVFTSRTKYRLKTADAQVMADYFAALLNKDTPNPVFTIEQRPDIQFMDIQDYLVLDFSKLSIFDNYYVGSITERWLEPTGQAVQTTIQAEPFPGQFGYLLLENGDYFLLENGDKLILG